MPTSEALKLPLLDVAFPPPEDSLPVMERAYWVVVSMLYESGLRGVAELKTAVIAQRAFTTETTILRHAKSRDGLVEQSINWCWRVVNERLAEATYIEPLLDSGAEATIVADIDHLLSMFDDPGQRIWATGALLGYRRPNAFTGGGGQPECDRFLARLESLCSNLVPNGELAEPEILASFLVNSVATVWFTWLLKPELAQSSSLISKDFALEGIRHHLESCVSREMRVS